MSATLTWTDAVGSASLSNIAQIPVSRFDGWTPDVKSIGETAFSLDTGKLYQFEFRVDDLVSFRIDNLKGSQLALMRRLKLHLLRGGEVAVSASNELGENFSVCTLAPDTQPQISEPNREREYTFSVTLKAGEGSEPFPCIGTSPTSDVGPGGSPGLLIHLQPDKLIETFSDDDSTGFLPDVSGHGHHAWQGNRAKWPIIKADTLNGHTVLEYHGFLSDAFGTAFYLITEDFTAPSSGTTWFNVLRRLGGGNEAGYIFGFASEAGGDPIGNNLSTYGWTGGGGLKWGSGTGEITIDGAYPDTGGPWVLHTTRYNSPSSQDHWLNDVYIGNRNPDPSAEAVQAVMLGRGVTGQMADTWGFDGPLTDGQVANEQAAINAIFNIY